jgi:hypothetical protein
MAQLKETLYEDIRPSLGPLTQAAQVILLLRHPIHDFYI